MIELKNTEPFARGGNRLCFVHPNDPQLCIKVRRPDFTLEDLRRKKGFPKNLRPLSSFDDNLEEFRVMKGLEKNYNPLIFDHLSRCYGFVETDYGKGLVSDLIRSSDKKIAQTLKKYIWQYGLDDPISLALTEFVAFWRQYQIPSRDLILHNLIVQVSAEGMCRLYVIDGLGSSSFIPYSWQPRTLRKSKIERRLTNLYARVDDLLALRGQDTFPGYHGELFHDGV